MHKIYIKQAWQMLKEDKILSIITILGTVLAITMTMVVILAQEIKTKNIAPEVNRERTMYIGYVKEASKDFTSIGPVEIKFYKQYLSKLETPETVSLINRTQREVNLKGSDVSVRTDIKYTDSSFWNIFRFSFLKGKHFSKEEFQSGIPVAVMCKSLSQKLFKGEDPLGKEFIFDERAYKVIGLVEDVPTLCNHAYSQIWIPYTSDPAITSGYEVVLLAKSKNDFQKIKAEVRENETKYNIEIDKVKINFWGPFSQQELLVRGGNVDSSDYGDPNLLKNKLKFFLTLSVLLLIPAINLSGFSLFKIISRTSEIGIRKAFGANKKTILFQVLYENMLTSIIGGVIGLIFSFITVTLIKDHLFPSNGWQPVIGENTIPVSAFISLPVFFYVFIACLILNLLSTGIPAWKASRLNIVTAIKN